MNSISILAYTVHTVNIGKGFYTEKFVSLWLVSNKLLMSLQFIQILTLLPKLQNKCGVYKCQFGG